ncbi:MAG: LacI family DNA-binding transcriptional regulator, partial [bacterium]
MGDKTKVTVKYIAEKAGVSYATASLALSGKGRISDSTRKKILEIASELGYPIDKKSISNIPLIAFVDANSHMGGFYMSLIEGVIDRLREYNYAVLLDICGEFGPDRIIERKKRLEDFHQNYDGILILSHWGITVEEVLPLLDHKKPFIVLDGTIKGFARNYVTVDHYQGAFDAVEYLIQVGHRYIAHISGPQNHEHAQLRLNAYIDALKKYKLPVREEYIVEGDYHKKSGIQAMEKLLNLKPLPSAIFVANDNMAITAMQVAKDKGYHIPQDISFIGFDDIQAAELSEPPLTTVRQPLYDVGKEGAEMLIELLESRNLVIEPRVLR